MRRGGLFVAWASEGASLHTMPTRTGQDMITLHALQYSRATRVLWLLADLGEALQQQPGYIAATEATGPMAPPA